GKEDLEPSLLRLLCEIVEGPCLLVSRLLRDGINDDHRVFAAVIAGADQPRRDDVLAREFAELEILTLAGGLRADGHAVGAAAGLRRHNPRLAVTGDLAPCRNLQSLQLAQIHGASLLPARQRNARIAWGATGVRAPAASCLWGCRKQSRRLTFV